MENINNNADESSIKDEHKIYSKNVILAFVIFLLLIIIGYFYLQHSDKTISGTAVVTSDNIKNKEERLKRNFDAYNSSLFQNNPMELQNLFLEDIKNGVNDEYTKSSIYFITHRFFDNGGNIFEIYDYVEAHPELAFLKEAELMYPEIFSRIKKKKKDLTYRSHLYAYCAYVDVLIKHGYGDIASVTTIANQYAKLAYFSKMILSLNNVSEKEEKIRKEGIGKNIEKSLKYIVLADPDIKKIISGEMTEKDVPARDILVGMNQFASSLRYLEASGVQASTTISSKEVFLFSSTYSRKHVNELIFFTAFLNASTLVLISSSTPEEIKVALYPILDFDTKKVKNANTSFNLGILGKIIDVKSTSIPKKINEGDLDIYGKRNVVLLAKKAPEFKKWLMYNGWQEADFKY